MPLASMPLMKSLASVVAIIMCAAISNHGVIHHHATLGRYYTAHLITFLDILHPTHGPEQLKFVVIWDNISFHRAALVCDWFTAHLRFYLSY